MKYKFSEKNKEIVEQFFQEPASVSMLKELGEPGKIKVDWNKWTVTVRGTKEGRILNIDDILDCHYDPQGLKKRFKEENPHN